MNSRICAGACALLLNMLALAPAAGAANSYQECLLEANRQGLVIGPTAVGKIKKECRERFPASAPNTAHVRFDDKKLAEIDLWTSRASNGDIKGTVYNGNPDVALLQMTLLLSPVKTPDPVQDFFDSEEFEITLDIPPYGTGVFTIPAAETRIQGRFRWNIIQASGY